MKSMQELIDRAKAASINTLAVAVAEDEAVMEAVEKARSDGIVNAVLFGDEKRIHDVFNTLSLETTHYTIIHTDTPQEACAKAVEKVATTKNSILMKGIVDTSVILKAALIKEGGLRTNKRLSHVSVMELANYHKLLFMSDGAMNIAPNAEEKQDIIDNAVAIARATGNDRPSVGLIAAVEKINPKMPSTLHAQHLVEHYKDASHCTVDGPFGLDNAINKSAAAHKGIKSPIAGDVDILLMPMIEAGNVFYKSMMFLADAKSASVIAGAKQPIVLTSRADDKLTKYHSIALGAIVSQGQ